MSLRQSSTVGRHLLWVFFQAFFLLPAIPFEGDMIGRGDWLGATLGLAISLWILVCLTRNLVLLWRAPEEEADRGSVARLGAVGLVLAMAASGRLWEEDLSGRSASAPLALVACCLLYLAARDVARVRRRRTVDAREPALTRG